MTPIPRLRLHDTLGLAVQRANGTWQVVPHGATEAWAATDVWITANPGWQELTVEEET